MDLQTARKSPNKKNTHILIKNSSHLLLPGNELHCPTGCFSSEDDSAVYDQEVE